MNDNIKLLEQAIINLTIENAKLKIDFNEEKERGKSYWKWYQDKTKILEEIEFKNSELRKTNSKLRAENSDLIEFKETHIGLWAIDKQPTDIPSMMWLQENAFQIKDNIKELVQEAKDKLSNNE